MKLINWFKQKYRNWKNKRLIRKRLKEIQERDPFIYD